MFAHDDQTIIAQCTPQGSGALALLRITGYDALEVASKIAYLPNNKQLISLPTHTIHYGWVVDHSGQKVDQVMFLLMHAPQTFTGQDTVEITCHNNQFLIQAIMESAIEQGARLAQPGEFTRRAVINNKLDLVQAEAINELINAKTHQTLKLSLAQLQGTFSHWIAQIEKELVKALAFSEASFEFVEEETEFGQQIKQLLATVHNKINTIKHTFNQQKQIREGIRIALIGSVNAGKSSLFNLLLQQERAIVTPLAGTTRDSIEAGLSTTATNWTLVDTAGLRHTSNSIEKKGVERSFKEAQKADVILLVFDSSRILIQQEQQIYKDLYINYKQKILVIKNKTDLPEKIDWVDFVDREVIEASSKKVRTLEVVTEAIVKKISQLFAEDDSPFLLNQRQFNLVLTVEKELETLEQLLTGNIQYEILSLHLKEALRNLTELTGKTISERAMDTIFKEFCIGK